MVSLYDLCAFEVPSSEAGEMIKNISHRAAEITEKDQGLVGFAQELKKVFHTLHLISLSEIKTPPRLCALERSGRDKKRMPLAESPS